MTQYEDIYSNNIENMKEVYQRFEKNINERERIMNQNENEDKNEKVNKRKIAPFGPDKWSTVYWIVNSNGENISPDQ